jgi:hypothetical protein
MRALVKVFGLVAILFAELSFGQAANFSPPQEKVLTFSTGKDVANTKFPHLLFDQRELSAFASSSSPIIVSARAELERQVVHKLGSMQDDLNVYKGCRLDIYTKRLTYEHGSASRDAADFAIYSAVYSSSQADSARRAAVEILMKWAQAADYISEASNKKLSGFCDESGNSSEDARFAVGLTFGRGMPSLIVAYEVLRAQNALTPYQADRIEKFFDIIYRTELVAMNYRAKYSNLDCNRFNNHVSVQLAALTMLAALRGDHNSLNSVAMGSGEEISIPLSTQISKAIYTAGANPLSCFSNKVDPTLYYQIPRVEDGEIVDRYRSKPNQTFGYPMFSLEHMLQAELVLERKGVAQGIVSRERLLAALHYYGDLLLQSENGNGLAKKFSQYQGKNIFGGENTITGGDFMINSFIIGAILFPDDKQIGDLISHFAEKNGAFTRSPSLYLPLLVETLGN